MRVAIIPPTFDSIHPGTKRYSETLADYLQGKLHDTAGVEWVERGDLDKLLEEVNPAFANGVSISPMVLGRLLKADVVLSGYLEDSSTMENGQPGSATILKLQVTDLTNASVLAEEKTEYFNEFGGIRVFFPVLFSEPSKVAAWVPSLQSKGSDAALQRLQAMTPDQIAAEVRKAQAAELEKAAVVGRKLLAAGLAERRATAGATQLVSIFFADAGVGLNFDDWEEKWQAALREEAAVRPGVRLLQFLGIEQARQEQKLALLGLTQADPVAWQSTADGYIWGSYQVIPGTQTMTAGETEVEAEVFLRLGADDPKRFVRRFKTKDFPDAVRALAREVVEAARDQHPRRSSEANAGIAQMIFGRLCALVNGGFFQADPPLASTLPPTSDIAIGTYGAAVLDPIKHLPHGQEKLAYCRKMLEVACFFDPDDNRLQMLRWTLANPPFGTRPNPDQQLEPTMECVELLERIAHARGGFDAAAFATGVEAVMNDQVRWPAREGWSVWDDTRGGTIVVPDQIPAQREALLNVFLPLVEETLPTVSARLDKEKTPLKGRRFLAQWLGLVLDGDVKPELRMQYLAAAWPYTQAMDCDLTSSYLKLMDDLGDRKRVQSVLMQPKQMDVPSAAPPRADAPAPPARSTPPVLPLTGEPVKNIEALLADWKPAQPPPILNLPLPLDRFGVGNNFNLPFGRTPEEKLALAIGSGPDSGVSVRRIDGFGDQLVLGLSAGGPAERHEVINVHLLFQTSSEAVRLLGATTSGLVCGDEGRVLYRQGESGGWTDLLTSKGGVFSPDTGSPVGIPAVVGFDGTGRAVVAAGGAQTVALFDWDKRTWLILPPPPVPPRDLGVLPYNPAEALGAGDAIIFPLWNLVFDQAKQKWRALPDGACLPLAIPSAYVPRPRRGPVAGDRFCVDDHLWSWNEHGITDFSVSENRVAWHGDASRLCGVCRDGTRLWMALGREGAGLVSEESTLVLFDCKQHAVLGTMNLPFPVTALHADDRQLWMGGAGGGQRSNQATLRCINKDKLYTALPGVVPPKAAPWRRAVPADPETALYATLLGNDPDAARQLLDRGTSANTVFGEGRTPALMVAAWAGSEPLCHLLLAHGATLDALLPTDHKAWTALATAARQDNEPLLRILLEAGAKPTEAALTEALRNEDFETSASLIKAGAPLWNLAAVVSERQNEALARRILDLHPPLPPAEQAKLAVLVKATDEPISDLGDNPKEIAKLLQRTTEDRAVRIVRQVSAACLRRPELRSSFISMIRRGYLPVVDAFLDAGVSPSANPSEPTWERPLNAALWHPDVFLLLLRRGADPRLWDAQESTVAEHVAEMEDAAAILPALLERYPALETRHGYGTLGGSLLCAVATGRARGNSSFRVNDPPAFGTSTLRMLLDRGVSPNARGREGFTALHGAFAVRSASLACWLAGAGADLSATDLAGRTVFDAPYCTFGERDSFAGKLRTYAPRSDQEAKGQQRLLTEISARGSYQELFDAVGRRDLAGVRGMLQKGWSVLPPFATYSDPASNFSRNPGLVFLAVKNGQREMVGLLLDHGSDANIGQAGCDFYATNESPLAKTAQPFTTNQRPLPRGRCPTPLIVAAEAGDLPMVDLLLDHGAYVPAIDQFLRNAVDAAATPELAVHIDQRAHAQFAMEKLLTALGLKSSGAKAVQRVQQILTETPEALRTPDETGTTPLSMAMA